MLSSVESILGKGQSLAPVLKTYPLKDLLVGITEYPRPVETGRWHAHKNPLISFVLEGGNIENRKGKQLQRSCGSINFYHAYEPHQNIYQVFPSKHFSIEIDEVFLERYGLSESRVHAAVEQNPFSKFLFLKMLREVVLNDSVTRESAEMLFLELVSSTSDTKNRDTCPDWVLSLREILNDNWNRQPSLRELSDAIGIHPVTISGNFRKYFSSTYGEYMRKIKVDRSLPMVRKKSQSLTRVAYACGFADQSHFTRTFKRQTGFLPKQYRKL